MRSRYDNIITAEEIEDARNKNFIYELNEDDIKNLNSNVDFNKERDTNSENIVIEQELILKDRGEFRKNIEETPVILSPDKIENRTVNFNSIENKEVIDGNKKIDILEDKLNIESNNIKETIVNSEDRVSLFSGKINGKSY